MNIQLIPFPRRTELRISKQIDADYDTAIDKISKEMNFIRFFKYYRENNETIEYVMQHRLNLNQMNKFEIKLCEAFNITYIRKEKDKRYHNITGDVVKKSNAIIGYEGNLCDIFKFIYK